MLYVPPAEHEQRVEMGKSRVQRELLLRACYHDPQVQCMLVHVSRKRGYFSHKEFSYTCHNIP